MAGTAVFQSSTLATPGAGIVVHTDNINGTVAQMIKVDVGPAGTSVLASYAAGTGLPVQGIGTFVTKDARTTSSAITSINAAISDTMLLGINTGRFGASVYAEGPGTLFLKLGNSASTTSYTVQMTPQTYYEVPFGWTGSVNGIWGTQSGTARITEIT